MLERGAARWLSVDEIAAALHVTRRQVLRLVRDHRVPVLRPTRRVVLFDAVARQALEEACRSTFVVEKTRDRSKSTARYARPAKGSASELENAQDLTMKLLREKKRSHASGKSSATSTSASVLIFGASPKRTDPT